MKKPDIEQIEQEHDTPIQPRVLRNSIWNYNCEEILKPPPPWWRTDVEEEDDAS